MSRQSKALRPFVRELKRRLKSFGVEAQLLPSASVLVGQWIGNAGKFAVRTMLQVGAISRWANGYRNSQVQKSLLIMMRTSRPWAKPCMGLALASIKSFM